MQCFKLTWLRSRYRSFDKKKFGGYIGVIKRKSIDLSGRRWLNQKWMEEWDSQTWLILRILCWLNKCGVYCIANPPFSTRCLKLFFWTKHIFIFTYNIFSFFPIDPSPFSLFSHNFRFLVLLQHLFQIGIHLLHTKTIAFLVLSLPNFRFLFF